MNELLFQQYLKKNFPFSRGQGIGDDASVIRPGGIHQLITTDLLVENIHFRLQDIAMNDLALKALAVNLSDVAAMGGIAQYFYLGLGCPSGSSWEELKKFFQGLKNGCKRWDLELAGGDFSQSSHLFISITMVGKAKHPVYRHNARTGDLIGITGHIGAASLGLRLLLKGFQIKPWTSHHQKVNPHLAEGQILSKYVNSMIDVSDGLIIDLKRVLDTSGKGGHLYYEKLPIIQSMKKVCQEHHFDERELVLSGGEDYVLLFTISPEKEKQLRRENIRYRIIGNVVSRKNQLIITHHGNPLRIENTGYDHFLTKK
jgi:thiamine-monophosphate kinase